MTTVLPAFDRLNARRDEPGLVESLRQGQDTLVVPVHDGRVPVSDDALVYVRSAEVVASEWALLGADAADVPILLAVVDAPLAVPGARWEGVREAAGRLGPEAAEQLLTAVALAAWIRDAPFCPRCGEVTVLKSAGWARRCEGCESEHFPRTDPAVIVAIESSDGERLLLGANALWRGKMFSCFAGFVEAGESLEATVHREIEEEAGVRLHDLRFVGSQSWPYPRSLMVGFRATAVDESRAKPDGEEIIELRWFTRAQIASALAGEGPVGLPGPASIARRLIVDWWEDGR